MFIFIFFGEIGVSKANDILWVNVVVQGPVSLARTCRSLAENIKGFTLKNLLSGDVRKKGNLTKKMIDFA